MRRVITYGTFDLLHRGHIALLERARSLGDYLIVGVTSDQFDRGRGKLNVVQPTLERVDAVRATGIADMVIIEEYEGQKIEDIQRYDVDIFTVGSDWRGYFDYLSEWCEVVYLDRTQGVSSTQIREETAPSISAAVVANRAMCDRFDAEASAVSGLSVTLKLDVGSNRLGESEFRDALQQIDAVILAGPFNGKLELIRTAIDTGKHVLYIPPACRNRSEQELMTLLASRRNVVLQEGLKTLFFPAFRHLMLLVESGKIGKVHDIELSCSQIPEGFFLPAARFKDSAMLDWGALASMPIAHLLGTDPSDISFSSCVSEGGCAYFTRCHITYPDAAASFAVGKGIKTEGDLVITGTRGYVYVPSPWWLTDYFEIRHEDLTKTRKFYWEYAGDGLRYELLEFVRRIRARDVVPRGFCEHAWSSHITEEFLASIKSGTKTGVFHD